MNESVIRAKVDEFVRWVDLAAEAKKEIEKMKAEFQKHAVELMKDKKVKQVEFWGTKNAKVTVTTTGTLKLVSYSLLQKVFGETLLRDFVKEDPQYKLSEPFKRLLAAIFQGDYIEQPVDEVIAQVSDDEKIRKTLKKKLKGNWDKDIGNLKAIAGLGDREAEHFAYFIQEAMNYEKIAYLLEAAGYPRNSDEFEKALDGIRHAVVVEEGIKVGLETEEIKEG